MILLCLIGSDDSGAFGISVGSFGCTGFVSFDNSDDTVCIIFFIVFFTLFLSIDVMTCMYSMIDFAIVVEVVVFVRASFSHAQ